MNFQLLVVRLQRHRVVRQLAVNRPRFCFTPSTSTDSMTTGGGLVFGLNSAGFTDIRPSIVGNKSRPSWARMAAGCAPTEHSRVRKVRPEIFLAVPAATSAERFFLDPHQAFIRADPEIGEVVFDQIADIVAHEPVT